MGEDVWFYRVWSEFASVRAVIKTGDGAGGNIQG